MAHWNFSDFPLSEARSLGRRIISEARRWETFFLICIYMSSRCQVQKWTITWPRPIVLDWINQVPNSNEARPKWKVRVSQWQGVREDGAVCDGGRRKLSRGFGDGSNSDREWENHTSAYEMSHMSTEEAGWNSRRLFFLMSGPWLIKKIDGDNYYSD